MPYSLSMIKREVKSGFDRGTLAPTAGQTIELRVDNEAFRDFQSFWGEFLRLQAAILDFRSKPGVQPFIPLSVVVPPAGTVTYEAGVYEAGVYE